MTAKKTAVTLLAELDDNASWSDVKNVIVSKYKKETGDATVDAISAIVLCVVFVTSCIFWVSLQ
jgi:hypothetical protein